MRARASVAVSRPSKQLPQQTSKHMNIYARPAGHGLRAPPASATHAFLSPLHATEKNKRMSNVPHPSAPGARIVHFFFFFFFAAAVLLLPPSLPAAFFAAAAGGGGACAAVNARRRLVARVRATRRPMSTASNRNCAARRSSGVTWTTHLGAAGCVEGVAGGVCVAKGRETGTAAFS